MKSGYFSHCKVKEFVSDEKLVLAMALFYAFLLIVLISG